MTRVLEHWRFRGDENLARLLTRGPNGVTVKTMGESSERDALLRQQVELLGLVAHDVKNPISAALANLAFVEQVGVTDPDALEAITDAVDAVKRVRQLVDDLVVSAKHDARVLELRRASQRLEPILSAVVTILAKDAELRRTGLTAEPSSITATVDAPVIQRALELLVDCALRWGKPGGRVTVSASEQNGRVSVCVVHDSCTLADQARAKAFMADPEAPPVAIGLSLYYASRAASAHGGRLVLTSQPGTFTVELA